MLCLTTSYQLKTHIHKFSSQVENVSFSKKISGKATAFKEENFLRHFTSKLNVIYKTNPPVKKACLLTNSSVSNII